ncbi:hypothetical protein [Pedobacter sp. NJ-S-72]
MVTRLLDLWIILIKKKTGLLFPQNPVSPTNPGVVASWVNLPGTISNKGIELTLNANIIDKPDVSLSLGGNATFIKNKVETLEGIIKTGSLSGQGLSGVTLEVLQQGLPLFAMVTREYTGLNAGGQSISVY